MSPAKIQDICPLSAPGPLSKKRSPATKKASGLTITLVDLEHARCEIDWPSLVGLDLQIASNCSIASVQTFSVQLLEHAALRNMLLFSIVLYMGLEGLWSSWWLVSTDQIHRSSPRLLEAFQSLLLCTYINSPSR